jgi:hypothetical protein
MRIAFNLLNCGLGNNGGSQTIIRMANELSELGNEVNILINQPNRFTWFDIPENLILRIKDEIPQFDIIIATGCSTVDSTITYELLPIEKKFYWIRAIEDWAMPMNKLILGYISGLNLIVNSEWQRRFIHDRTGIVSSLVYSGLPIDEIYEKIEMASNDYVINGAEYTGINIGALASKKSRKRFKDVIEIAHKLNEKKILNKLILISNEQIETPDNINAEVIVRPDMLNKIKAMYECDVWLSTTINEGLHIPPLEAGLSGCLLVSRDREESGVSDYCVNNFSSLNYLDNDEAVNQVIKFLKMKTRERTFINDNFNSIVHNKIGTVRDNAKKMLKVFRDGI